MFCLKIKALLLLLVDMLELQIFCECVIMMQIVTALKLEDLIFLYSHIDYRKLI